METTKEKVLKYLEKIPYLNSGGCLVAAYSVFLAEEKDNNLDEIQLVALNFGSYSDPYIRKNLMYIKGKRKKADSASHFGWTYDNGSTIFDSDGKVRTWRYSETKNGVLVIPQNLTRPFAISSLNHGRWNQSFDRKKYVKLLSKKFDLDLSEVWTTRGNGYGDFVGG